MRSASVQSVDDRSLKGRSWHKYLIAGAKNVTQAFGIYKEEQLVFRDWPAQRCRPLIVVLEGAGCAGMVVEPVVGGQGAARPPILGVAMPVVAAGFGGVVHLRAGLASILPGVAVGHDRSFLQLVGAQQKVGGAGVVQVEVGVHLVIAVDGE